MAEATLLYDADCGFCRWTMALVLDLDRSHRIRPLALQDPEADVLLAARVPPERKMESIHLVFPDGRLYSSGDAMRETFRLLPAGTPLARALQRAPGPTERAYRWIAENRGVFGRTVGRIGRERAKRRIAERN